jgi:hypothetical protein
MPRSYLSHAYSMPAPLRRGSGAFTLGHDSALLPLGSGISNAALPGLPLRSVQISHREVAAIVLFGYSANTRRTTYYSFSSHCCRAPCPPVLGSWPSHTHQESFTDVPSVAWIFQDMVGSCAQFKLYATFKVISYSSAFFVSIVATFS